MIIMGIDPGLAIVGYGVISNVKGKITPIDIGTIVTPKEMPTALRLVEIADGLNELIDRYHPEQIAIEELFYFNNQKTVITVSEARGVILYAITKRGVPYFEYTPMQIKLAITGYGSADKKQMQQMVAILCNLKAPPKPDDAADAVAVAICHAQSARIGSISGFGAPH